MAEIVPYTPPSIQGNQPDTNASVTPAPVVPDPTTPALNPVTNPTGNLPTLTIHPKVAAPAVSGAVTIIVLFLLNHFAPWLVIPADVAAAFTTIVGFIAGYSMPSNPS